MTCLRICPTEAIRVRGGKATIIEELCIECGECINICSKSAITPLTDSFTDLDRFDYTVAIPSPVLYSQFDQKILPGAILEALFQVGFDCVCDVTAACEAVSFFIQRFLESYSGPKPLISCFCPTVVRLIQVRFPELIDQILPIESPMEIAALGTRREAIKREKLKPEAIGVIYITPCPAKMMAIKSHPRKARSNLDGAISIKDIYSPLLTALNSDSKKKKVFDGNVSGLGVGWAKLGGEVKSLKAENSLAVAGLTNVIRILEDVENRKLRDIDYLECHSCPEGCIGGSLTVENPYVSRSKIISLVNNLSDKSIQDEKRIDELYGQKDFFLKQEVKAQPLKLSDDMATAIERMKSRESILQDLPQIDCGVCGAPTCQAFADDVVRGRAKLTDCIFKAQVEVIRVAERLLQIARQSNINAS
jgi:iron only hydrogenase large subunit-like protein